ncbi:MAG: transglutaminase-like cysteine peptidase [Magnetococcales bacterium]|nr:transglutaminase-like cysteine peptidase [Magnetococcales bacterium]
MMLSFRAWAGRGWGSAVLLAMLWVGGCAAAHAKDPLPISRLFEEPFTPQDASGRGDKWTRLMADHAQRRAAEWESDLAAIRDLPFPARLQAVQERINQRIVYRDDPENIWKTPIDAYRTGGDCEDYAIAKMLLLQESGFAEKHLRVVTLAPAAPAWVHHVILIAWLQEKIYVLDSPKRTPGSRVVALDDYRDRGREVVWAAWNGGYVVRAPSGAGGDPSATPARGVFAGVPSGALRVISYRQFPLQEKLARIAADWLIIHPWEPPLTPAEVERLRLLRRYYHEPTPEHSQALTGYEVRKLEELRRLRQAL